MKKAKNIPSIIVLIAMIISISCLGAHAQSLAAKIFSSPKAAVSAFFKSAKSKDYQALFLVLGENTREWVLSGDNVQDELARQKFINSFQQKNRIEFQNEKLATLYIGNDEFPFPFPIVKSTQGWSFNAELGKQEILDRRIGKNELNTIQVLFAIVDAQKEYAAIDRDGNGVLEYAQKFRSSNGSKDGLFWQKSEGGISPLGPLIAEAVFKGYGYGNSDQVSIPYFGYHYKILKAQGPKAQGGAFEYIVNGKMIGGFAVIAYPSNYGVSGFKTFKVNYQGSIYESDLGEATTQDAELIEVYNPDGNYEPTKH